MSRIKVAGYSKKIDFGNGIEYRPFSSGLLANKVSDTENTLFTSGNFSITTNIIKKVDKNFLATNFYDFVSLDDLKKENFSYVDKKIILNLDKSNISNYSYFGPFKEYLRVSLEKIIINWPASLYVSPVNSLNPNDTGDTYENVIYDDILKTTYFEISPNRITNNFNLNYLNNNLDSDRNFFINYRDYCLMVNNIDYNILNFSFSDNLFKIKVDGKPFDNANGFIAFHIKPNKLKIDNFFNSLNNLEGELLNRFSRPLYTSKFNYELESDNGAVILTNKELTWPLTDGYNIDFNSEKYVNFVSELLSISESNDGIKSDLINRFFVSDSILSFDTVDSKMKNTLTIYGREFDEIKNYIDGISTVNNITYNKKDNIPDYFLGDLAKNMGWELSNNIKDIKDEFIRKLIINTPWIWKSKGTRKSIEFLLNYIGVPSDLIEFNEYVYVADNKINLDYLNEVIKNYETVINKDDLPIDSLGFPKPLLNNSKNYFQKGGLWYRETGGINSNLDVLKGNNPHIGSYDNGFQYINQFNELIPNFKSTKIINNNVKTNEINIFNSYDNGKFDGILDNSVSTKFDLTLDFKKILSDKLLETVNGLSNSPNINTISATTEWSLTLSYENSQTYGIGTPFVPSLYITNGVILGDSYLMKYNYYNTLLDILNLLNTNYFNSQPPPNSNLSSVFSPNNNQPINVANLDSISFSESNLNNCDSYSYYRGKKIKVGLYLKINYNYILNGNLFSGYKDFVIPIKNDVFRNLNDKYKINLELTDINNNSMLDCFNLKSNVVKSKDDFIKYDECGCEIFNCSDSFLKIEFDEKIVTNECNFSGFTLNVNNFVLFNFYDGTNSFTISSECCESLGFTSEVVSNLNKCRWREDIITCDNYTPQNLDVDNYMVFITPNGSLSTSVPLSTCCPNTLTPILNSDGTYKCHKVVNQCGDYINYTFDNNGFTVFNKQDGTQYSEVYSPQCCDGVLPNKPNQIIVPVLTSNGTYLCIRHKTKSSECNNYNIISTDDTINPGYSIYTFYDSDNFIFTPYVPLSTCCPSASTPIVFLDELNTNLTLSGYFKCLNNNQ